MRVAVAAAALLVGMLVPAAAPASPVPGGPITIASVGTLIAKAAPATAGSRPTQLTLQLRTELQCGRPGAGPILVSLPDALQVPAHIAVATVAVNGGTAAVTVSGHVVTILPKRWTGLMCDVVGPGTISVVFSRAAGLGNPASPGRYPVTVRSAGRTGHATLIVS